MGGVRAVSRIKELGERVADIQADGTDPWRTAIERELAEAQRKTPSGACADRLWPAIPSLEERVTARDGDLVHLGEQVAHHLSKQADAAARKVARAEFDRLCTQALGDRRDDPVARDQAPERAQSIITESHLPSRVKYDSARKTQIGLIWCSVLLGVIALAAVFAQSKSVDEFVPRPASTDICNALLLALLLGAGALGGVLSALFSLYLTKDVEDTSWFDPRPALAMNKVMVGAWASVIAALAVGTGVLVGRYASVPAALLIGVAFGYAQQALIGFIDKYTTGLAAGEPKESLRPRDPSDPPVRRCGGGA